MAKFSFTAQDSAGARKTGTIEAATKLQAADKLFNELQLTVLDLTAADEQAGSATALPTSSTPAAAEEATPKGFDMTTSLKKANDWVAKLNTWVANMSGVPVKEKVIFFRLLAVMINAGLPIVKALGILTDQTANPRLKNILVEVKSDVESGRGFSHSLDDYPEVFTDAELGVIAAGEASGQMNRALLDLATTTEKSANLQRKIKGAMIYPIVVLVIVGLVTVAVMTLVIPKLKDLFSNTGHDLPAATQFLINMSNWFMGTTLGIPNIGLLFVGIFGIIIGIKAGKKTEEGLYLWDSIMMKLPIFGPLVQKVALSALAGQLSTLTASGISIIRSIDITASAVGNEVYKRRLLEIKGDVEAGKAIHQVIEGDPLFPPLFQSMVTIGEQTAQLSNVTKKIAEFYDEEVDNFVKNLSTIMEPVIIVVVGGLVGGLVAAIMQPIMQIADIASQQ